MFSFSFSISVLDYFGDKFSVCKGIVSTNILSPLGCALRNGLKWITGSVRAKESN